MQALTYGRAFGDTATDAATDMATPAPTGATTPPPTLYSSYLDQVPKPVRIFYQVMRPVGFIAGAYHGYVRNQSIGWGIWWALMGTFFPVLTTTFAVAQGFNKKRSDLRGRLRGRLPRFSSARRRRRSR